MAYGALKDESLFCCEGSEGDAIGKVTILGSDAVDDIRLHCPQITDLLTPSFLSWHANSTRPPDEAVA